MPKIDIAAVPETRGSFYPEPWAALFAGRSRRRLGAAAGLTQFGANLITLEPGTPSSLRHWHQVEDEFVWVVEGELVLVQDGGETVMRAGDCAAFPGGEPDGHHFVNRTGRIARFLVVGTCLADDVCTYSDVDLIAVTEGGRDRFTRRDGTPIETLDE